jgi:mannosyl-3-phosphoglycerate phosphatase family protein
LLEHGVSVVFCSAKTRAEQSVLRDDLDVTAPYIVENGAAVFGLDPPIVLGLPYGEVRSRLHAAAGAAGASVRGYGDMDLGEIGERTDLSPPEAARAAAREFSETFVLQEGSLDALTHALAERGLRVLRGSRFLTALGPHDKGIAVRSLLDGLGEGTAAPVTFAVGDYLNDLDMLASVDHPMLVQGPDGSWADIELPGLIRLPAPGPAGWVLAATRVLAELRERPGSGSGRR